MKDQWKSNQSDGYKIEFSSFISFLQSHILWIFYCAQEGCPSDKNPNLHCNYFLIPQLASSWNRIIWNIEVRTKSQSKCTVIIKCSQKVQRDARLFRVGGRDLQLPWVAAEHGHCEQVPHGHQQQHQHRHLLLERQAVQSSPCLYCDEKWGGLSGL